ncbi:hypothetical protein PT2222_350042 [Paraburkholderia tropica]
MVSSKFPKKYIKNNWTKINTIAQTTNQEPIRHAASDCRPHSSRCHSPQSPDREAKRARRARLGSRQG